MQLFLRIASNLWIIETISPRIEQALQLGLGIGAFGRDVEGLHFAQQALDPALELAIEFGPVHNQDHGRVVEARFLLQDEPGGRQQRKGLARALCMPNKPALPFAIATARYDGIDCPALMLPQHGFFRLAVLHIEENPVKRIQC
jgi:hypothetical protein